MTARKINPTINNYGPAISVGTSPEAIRELRVTIVEILSVPHLDNATRVAVLEALKEVGSTNGTNISDCSINVGKGRE